MQKKVNLLSKWLFIGVSVVLLVGLLALPVLAHSGNTDSSGGHYDQSSGDYHYHHGYPEHSHPNGNCPYSTDERRGNDGFGAALLVSILLSATITYLGVKFFSLEFKDGVGLFLVAWAVIFCISWGVASCGS